MRRLVVVIGFLLVAAFPATASAQVQPLEDFDPDYWWLPADNFRQPASSFPNATNFEMFDFTIYADFEDGEFTIEVATSPDADTDGTLKDVVDTYTAPVDPRVGTEGEVFTARTRTDAQWLATLGTYYWQGYRTEGAITWATKVYPLLIVERPPPDPPSDPPLDRTVPTTRANPPTAPAQVAGSTARRLTRSSAKTVLRGVIRTHSRRAPQRLTSSCALPTPFLARCDLTWRDARYRYKAKAKLTSTAGGMHAKIDGTRTKRACARRCRSAIHWSAALVG